MQFSRHFYKHSFETASNAILCVDESQCIIAFNRQAEKIFGYAESEITGRPLHLLLPEKFRKSHENYIKDFARGDIDTKEMGSRNVLYGRKKDGNEFPADISISRFVFDSRTYFLAIVRDISEKIRLQQELQQARDTAEAANKAKTDFLVNMSHEIRTPLNAIIGMAELVLDTNLDNEQVDFMKTIQAAANGLFSLVNDILDFSKIETGKMTLEKSAFNLMHVVEEIVDMFGPISEEKGLELILNCDPNIPGFLCGDALRLRQILINVVGNAVKFTHEGEIAVTIHFSDSESYNVGASDDVKLLFTVSDTGIGISKADIGKVFDKFSQVDSSLSRKYSGAGLGLPFCEKLLHLMGGKMWLESKESVGTSVYFDLDFEIDKTHLTPKPSVHRGEFVVLFDASIQRELMVSNSLSSLFTSIISVNNYRHLISFLKIEYDNIDLVILDLRALKKIDRYQIQELKAQLKLSRSKIILYAFRKEFNSDLVRLFQPCTLLAKPVKPSQLLRVVNKTATGDSQYNAPDNNVFFVDENVELNVPQRILVVEDNPDNKKLARLVLERDGYSVDEVGNGEEAVAAVRSSSYDLILMDIYMPGMDGFEATKKIRELEKKRKCKRVPILALTAHVIAGYRQICHENDMDDYIAKPVKPKELIAQVKKWCSAKMT